MPIRDILSFLKGPDTNDYYLVQDASINGFFMKDKKGRMVYQAFSSATSIRGHYEIKKPGSGEVLGILRREVETHTYRLEFGDDKVMATVRIKKQGPEVTMADGKLYAAVANRGKGFDFHDEDKDIRFTVDKKILSINDSYHAVILPEIEPVFICLIMVLLDDYYHEGTNN